MGKSAGNGIELLRMSIYVFFPVAVFYYFNVPHLFEKRVAEKRKILHPDGNRPPLSWEENEKLRLQLKEERRKRRVAAAQERTLNS